MIAAIIVEYNPLHNGHIYHIDKTKEILSSLAPTEQNYIIAIMSGNFTQRGDIAVLNKYTRAKHAIAAGSDMVIELPSIYATSSAEYFANGAIQIASKIQNLDLIVFGAECDDIDTLTEIANITTSKEYDYQIKKYLDEGLSYPVSCEKSFKNLSKIDTNLINSPNNILGIEYIKQAKKLNLNAKFAPIKRVGASYNQIDFDNKFNSAKSIRVAIASNNFDLDELKVPKFVYDDLINYNIDYNKLFAIISHNCINIDSVYEDNEGIINRVKKYSQIANNYDELVTLVHTKRYTKSKIRRVLLHIALNHTNSITNIGKPNVLAVKADCKNLLSKIDFNGELTCGEQVSYSNKIYNIVSKDKITSNKMLII